MLLRNYGSKSFSYLFNTVADKVLAFKSIVAYRSGLAINTEVTEKEAEEGLSDVLSGECCELWGCNRPQLSRSF